MVSLLCKDTAATEKFGKLLASLLQSGDVLCLSGDLGAGKTFLTTALAEALGVEAKAVTSPTFSLMNIYQGRSLEIRHFDLYRLNSPEELEDIGFSEYAGGPGLTIIEWGELFAEELPEEYLKITITIEAAGRSLALEPRGQHYAQLCERIEKNVNIGN